MDSSSGTLDFQTTVKILSNQSSNQGILIYLLTSILRPEPSLENLKSFLNKFAMFYKDFTHKSYF